MGHLSEAQRGESGIVEPPLVSLLLTLDDASGRRRSPAPGAVPPRLSRVRPYLEEVMQRPINGWTEADLQRPCR